jgi:hypothetical protein
VASGWRNEPLPPSSMLGYSVSLKAARV